MEKKTATWNDIERSLNSQTLDDLDLETLEAFARVEPPPSGNPTFHLRFQDAKQRIYRLIDERRRAGVVKQPGLVASIGPTIPLNAVVLDPVQNRLVFADEARKADGLPSAVELNELPENFQHALAWRIALRVAPALATRGNFRFWPDGATRWHVESIIRALQAGLVNCTNNASRTPEQRSAAVAAERAAKRARRAARSDDSRALAAMSIIATAATGGSLGQVDFILKLVVRHRGFYPGFATSVNEDFRLLREEVRTGAKWASPGFYQQNLWFNRAPAETVTDGSSWNHALHAVGLAWAAAQYEEWTRGKLEVGKILDQLLSWLAGLPPDHDKDYSSSEMDGLRTDLDLDTGTVAARSVESHFGNDAVAIEDKLSRRALAQVLAQFLRDPRTRAPLTLSIEGPWGSGKTSFMRLLQDELSAGSQRKIRTIWFNPWRHQNQEELWAAFAIRITETIAEGLSWKERWRNWRRLHARLFNWQEGWRDLLALAVRFPLWLVTFALGFAFIAFGLVEAKDKEFLEATLWAIPGVTTLFVTGFVAWRKTNEIVGSPFEIDLTKHLAKPNYEGKTSFLAQFQAHFREFCRIYIPTDETYVVFIDDLDRCDVPKAAELMQAINLMLSDDAPFIYVLGMDRAKVAAGVAVHHRELLPFLYAREQATAGENAVHDLHTRGLEHGYEFIEKFIQLPFRLPPAEADALHDFIRSRLTIPAPTVQSGNANASSLPHQPAATSPEHVATPSTPASQASVPAAPPPPDESHLEAPLLFASRILNGNPRRVAQLINLVRLQRLLAPVLGAIVTDGQLAKWTAIALRWPVFLVDLSQDPKMLAQLLDSQEPGVASFRYRHWRDNPEFLNFIRSSGPAGIDSGEYDLNSPEIILALLRLGIAVPLVDDSKALARALARNVESW